MKKAPLGAFRTQPSGLATLGGPLCSLECPIPKQSGNGSILCAAAGLCNSIHHVMSIKRRNPYTSRGYVQAVEMMSEIPTPSTELVRLSREA